MTEYALEIIGSLNQAQDTNFELSGSLLSVAASTRLVPRLNVIDSGGQSYATIDEWYVANGYDDEDDFLTETGYASVSEYLGAHGYSSVEALLAAQAWPSVTAVLENCGVFFE